MQRAGANVRRAPLLPALHGSKREPLPKSKKERPASKGRVHKGRTGN